MRLLLSIVAPVAKKAGMCDAASCFVSISRLCVFMGAKGRTDLNDNGLVAELKFLGSALHEEKHKVAGERKAFLVALSVWRRPRFTFACREIGALIMASLKTHRCISIYCILNLPCASPN